MPTSRFQQSVHHQMVLIRATLVALALFLSLTIVGVADAHAAPAVETLAYGEASAQQFDAYYDRTATGQPWVLLVHGGSWMGGDKATQPNAALDAFRAAGFHVFSMNYRLSPAAGWPAQRDDTYAVLRYLRTHAAHFGIDPDRGALYGSSAGGHIAVSTAMRLGQVRAVVGIGSVLEPLRVWHYGHGMYLPAGTGVHEVTRNLAGWEALLFRGPPIVGYTGLYGRWQDGTPSNHVHLGAPPVLEVHSRGDLASPIQGAETFVNALNKAQPGAGRLITVAGDVHADSIIWGNAARKAEVLAFVKSNTQRFQKPTVKTSRSPLEHSSSGTGQK